jgi:hypothetical protein
VGDLFDGRAGQDRDHRRRHDVFGHQAVRLAVLQGQLLMVLEQLLGQERHPAALPVGALAQDQVTLADDADHRAGLDDWHAADAPVDQQANDVPDGRRPLHGEERGAHDLPCAHAAAASPVSRVVRLRDCTSPGR